MARQLWPAPAFSRESLVTGATLAGPTVELRLVSLVVSVLLRSSY